MAKFTIGTPTTGVPTTAAPSKTTNDPNRGVYREEDKLRNQVLEASALWKQLNRATLEGASGFIKAMKTAAKQMERYSIAKQITPSATGLKISPALQKQYDSMVSNLRQVPLPRAQLNKIGKVTSSLISDAVTESLSIAANTAVLKPLSRNQLNKIGKVTAPLIQDAITDSLTVAGRTGPMKKWPFQKSTPATTPFGGARATAPFGGATTTPYLSIGGVGVTTRMNYRKTPFGGLIMGGSPFGGGPPLFPHPAGPLPPLPSWSTAPTVPLAGSAPPPPPPPSGGKGKALLAAALELIPEYAAYKAWKKLRKSGEYLLGATQDALNLTTDFPTMEISGLGVAGSKRTSGIMGIGPYGTTGPTTVHEVMGLMDNSSIRRAFAMGGIPMDQWMKVMSAYGVRGGLPKAITMAGVLSHDNDLGYMGMEDRVRMLGTLAQRGYSSGQVGSYMAYMKGAVGAGFGANNLTKEFIESEIDTARENLAARGNVNPSGLASFMGGIMDSTKLPSLRTPGGPSGAMMGIQGAELGTIGNPYLFTTMARVIAKNGGSLEKAFGDLGPYEPMMKDLKGLPISQQIAIATQMGAITPEKLVTGITPYFKGLGANKVLAMQAEMNTLSGGGIDVSQYKDLIEAMFYGNPTDVKAAKLKIGDISAHTPGDTDELRRTKAREGATDVMVSELEGFATILDKVTKNAVAFGDELVVLTNTMTGWLKSPAAGKPAPWWPFAPVPAHGPSTRPK